MHYNHINQNSITDYASIAHGMPEYRVMTNSEIDYHMAFARQERSRVTLYLIRHAGRWIAGLFGAGKTTTA